jgi:hypothetical protein
LLLVADDTANAAAAVLLDPRQYKQYRPSQLAAVKSASVYAMLWCTLAGLNANTSTAVADSLSSCRNMSLSLHSTCNMCVLSVACLRCMMTYGDKQPDVEIASENCSQ